jgi:hypothetical protein
LGAVARIWLSESTTNCADSSLNVTDVAPVNPAPVIVTSTPPSTGTFIGENEVMLGGSPSAI